MSYNGVLFRPVTTQSISFDASVAMSNAVGDGVDAVYLTATDHCHIAIAPSPTATTSTMYLTKDWPYCLKIAAGEKVAAIKAAGASAGTLFVTEVSQ